MLLVERSLDEVELTLLSLRRLQETNGDNIHVTSSTSSLAVVAVAPKSYVCNVLCMFKVILIYSTILHHFFTMCFTTLFNCFLWLRLCHVLLFVYYKFIDFYYLSFRW